MSNDFLLCKKGGGLSCCYYIQSVEEAEREVTVERHGEEGYNVGVKYGKRK